MWAFAVEAAPRPASLVGEASAELAIVLAVEAALESALVVAGAAVVVAEAAPLVPLVDVEAAFAEAAPGTLPRLRRALAARALNRFVIRCSKGIGGSWSSSSNWGNWSSRSSS